MSGCHDAQTNYSQYIFFVTRVVAPFYEFVAGASVNGT